QTCALPIYAMIQYLLADGFMKAAIEGRDKQIPIVIPFLTKAERTLKAAISDLDKDRAYVRSPGSEPADTVINRKVGPSGVYSQLATFTQEGIALFNQKIGWDTDTLNTTIGRIQEYYDGAVRVYNAAIAVDAQERAAMLQAKQALQDKYNALETQRQQYMQYL